MSTDNGDYPSFPESIAISPGGDIHRGLPGLTKREYFAAKAMQGAWADLSNGGHGHYESTAKLCVNMADALLAELDK